MWWHKVVEHVYNTVLTSVMAVVMVITTALNWYISEQYETVERIEDEYILVGSEPESIRSQIFNGYTLEEYGYGYPVPQTNWGRLILEVPIINQKPELPNGCEIVCATSLLNYLGFPAEKVDMANNYLDKDSTFIEPEKDLIYGPDPGKVHVGDPFGWGYGCYAPVIVNSLNKYFEQNGSENRAYSLENLTEAHIELLLDSGVPLIVWATTDMKPYTYSEKSEWIFHGETGLFSWRGNSHTLLLAGYDNTHYFFMDPLDKTEYVSYPKSSFLNRWQEGGAQTVAVRINDVPKSEE